MTPARSPLQELADALAEIEFVNQYGHPWCLSDHGAMQVARAVAAHLARPETVERIAREFVRQRGGTEILADDNHWHYEVERYYEKCKKWPDYASGRSLITDAFTDAHAAVAAVVGEDV